MSQESPEVKSEPRPFYTKPVDDLTQVLGPWPDGIYYDYESTIEAQQVCQIANDLHEAWNRRAVPIPQPSSVALAEQTVEKLRQFATKVLNTPRNPLVDGGGYHRGGQFIAQEIIDIIRNYPAYPLTAPTKDGQRDYTPDMTAQEADAKARELWGQDAGADYRAGYEFPCFIFGGTDGGPGSWDHEFKAMTFREAFASAQKASEQKG